MPAIIVEFQIIAVLRLVSTAREVDSGISCSTMWSMTGSDVYSTSAENQLHIDGAGPSMEQYW